MTLNNPDQIALDASPESATDSRFYIRNADGSVVSILNDDGAASSPVRKTRNCSMSDDETPCTTPPPERLTFPSIKSESAHVPHDLRLPGLAAVASTLGYYQLTPPATPVAPQAGYLSTPLTPAPSAPSSPRSAATTHLQTKSATSSPPATSGAKPATRSTDSKRKHKCTYEGCGRSFTTSGHLSRHHRVHTGEKNFVCQFPGCNSRFSRQDNMMQHLRTHTNSRSRTNKRRPRGLPSPMPPAHAHYYPYPSPHSPHHSMASAHPLTPTSLSVPESPAMAHPHFRTLSYPSYPPPHSPYYM
ncbi:transcriptional repressor [Dimargaris verticillata]|uniref:Transcriptional repressor n=1 Tax=Dimargaris verticillata TaxID=2761393 RepID=A0A9W8EC28_9FUNG|nr:transcriptional repressor [Dimargaris verticillata]